MAKLNEVDPGWAWGAYEPDAQRPWNFQRAAHLFRRAGFGANWSQVQEAVKLGPAATLDRLFQTQGQAAPQLSGFDQDMAQLGESMVAMGDPRQLSAWWLHRMLFTPDQLLEKTTLFWHNHFATSAAKVTESRLMLNQNELLRSSALGKFEPLVQAISKDPAMLIWLDSTTNRKIRPNENYARELMELFCLGVGNYGERDIKEVARAFTGWGVRQNKFDFNPYQHDTGIKEFLGRSGNFSGEEAVRIVLDQPAAPRFIARKLVRYFVFDEPDAPDALIEPLAVELGNNGFDIGPVVRRILASNLLHSEFAIGRKVRSPVELGIGLLRALEAKASAGFLAERLDRLGQAVFFPPNVKGWDGGRAWITSASLLGRANFVGELTVGGKASYPQGSLAAQSQRDGAGDPESAVDRLLMLLVAVDVPQPARDSLIQLARSDGNLDAGLARVVHAIAAMPDFQLM